MPAVNCFAKQEVPAEESLRALRSCHKEGHMHRPLCSDTENAAQASESEALKTDSVLSMCKQIHTCCTHFIACLIIEQLVTHQEFSLKFYF